MSHQVWNQAGAPYASNSLLSRLRFLLSVDERDIRDVNLQKIASTCTSPELRHGLDEGHALNVSNRASKLDYANIRLLMRIIDRDFGNSFDPIYDGVRDMRNDLNGATEIVASSFPLNDVIVYLASGDVILACQGDVQVALVIAQVEVDFTAIVENEDFAVPWTMSAHHENDMR